MVFSSMIFLWLFLPLVLLIYFISCKKLKNLVLLFFSIIFYAWGEPKYVIVMLISIFINYILGILMDKYRKYDKFILIVSVLINLGLLGYYKYLNFLINIINTIFNNTVIEVGDIALPIGISFYTFQILSYLIDLYRKEIKVQKNILNLGLYISFFPQLIAGPIVRYKDIDNQINNREVTINKFASGIRRFVYGLGKKVILANNLALITDNILLHNVSELNTSLAWFSIICYTLQIYYDFSGYSDMAIGLGRMFGFDFQENFNLPYMSKSITEFWKRWHISLSTWFKQYLYIPLGGNRKGKFRTYINLIIVFLATGLWHGASFKYVVWGLYFGFFLLLEKIVLKKILDNNKFKFLNHFYVMLVVIISFSIFRLDALTSALDVIKLMFSFNFSKDYILLPTFINIKTIIIVFLSIILCGPGQVIFGKLKYKQNIKKLYSNVFEYVVIVLIMAISISELIVSSYNPFIYFRF